ncbi:hypothetical protein QBC34DRAFT_441524 [Podospora aff. communis PSN243]|uniref:Extracellular membrane protein CFEM domain-containing protein n=1 Tax=Podospora aff. communis PSN243 TaxID=3040156 RepID=A0AAV9GC02_9PEZI|nr:hypothetical protein QBC34DRAFT_441524 [Podospora aff. communis PSN243]
MRIPAALFVALFTLASHVHPVGAADGGIDWHEAGIGKLRHCATAIFSGCCPIQNFLGCITKSCLCRSDLIPDAQKKIKDAVSKDCGGKELDIDAAVNLYNDDCASNGFPVPGYTYVSTQTTRVSTGAPTPTVDAPATATATATQTTAGGGQNRNSSGTAPQGGGIAPTVTVYRSSASSHALLPIWTGLLSVLAFVPGMLRLVRAETVVVTYTEPPPPPAFSSVVTTRQTILTEPIVSTLKVTQTGSPESSKTGDSLGTNSGSNTGGNTGGKGELSALEVMGTVIGIVVGLITMVATLWMCLERRRGSI